MVVVRSLRHCTRILPDRVRFREAAAENPKADPDDFERVSDRRDRAIPRPKSDDIRIRVPDLDEPLSIPTTPTQLQEDPQLCVDQGVMGLASRMDRIRQPDERDPAWIAGIGPNILANDRVANDGQELSDGMGR